MAKRISFKQKHVAGPPDGEPWVWHTAELLVSRVWQTCSRSCVRLIDRLELEHMAHAGKENGRLSVGYGQFVDFGIGRRFIAATITEAEDRGLIVVESRGWKLKDVPNRYRLTYFASARKTENGVYEWYEPTNDWKTSEKRFLRAPLNKKNSKKVQKGEFSGAELPKKLAENLDSDALAEMQKGEPSTIYRSLSPARRSRSTGHPCTGSAASKRSSQRTTSSPDPTRTSSSRNSGDGSRRKSGAP
jgi:hypothetical protein